MQAVYNSQQQHTTFTNGKPTAVPLTLDELNQLKPYIDNLLNENRILDFLNITNKERFSCLMERLTVSSEHEDRIFLCLNEEAEGTNIFPPEEIDDFFGRLHAACHYGIGEKIIVSASEGGPFTVRHRPLAFTYNDGANKMFVSYQTYAESHNFSWALERLASEYPAVQPSNSAPAENV